MLGSFQDAEDALQDALLAAWQGLGGFEGRASIRTWLYRIATNRCLNALRSAKRRQAKEWDVPEIEPPEPTRLGEVVWLEPYPDALLEGAIDVPLGPEARYEQTEAHLAGLRDRAAGPARPPARRTHPARRTRLPRRRGGRDARLDRRLGQQRAQARPRRPAAPPAPAGERLAARRRTHPPSRRSWRSSSARTQSGDVDALVALLTDDVRLSMPPIPLEYHGRDAVARFYASIFEPDRSYDLVPTRGERPAGVRDLPPHRRPTASATGSASSSSPSAATGSAP